MSWTRETTIWCDCCDNWDSATENVTEHRNKHQYLNALSICHELSDALLKCLNSVLKGQERDL